MYWSWQKSGVALAVVFLLAIVLVKPIGVSTQFVIFDGMLMSFLDTNLIRADTESKTGYASTNAYLDKSGGKYAEAVSNPLNYGFVFVVSMVVGGFVASRTQKKRASQIPSFHQVAIGESLLSRNMLAFLGGVLVLYGARLAGGCTSGHMMSGMMQTALSGYVFAGAAFAAAIPTAILLYKRGGNVS